MQIVGKHEQGSKEWADARKGVIVASTIYRVMTASTKGLESLRVAIRHFRDTGLGGREFRSAATDWGKKYESQARASVEIQTGMWFDEVGLIVHDDFFYVGASPDGLELNLRVGLELKCPYNQSRHQDHKDKIATPYVWQCQAGMWVTGYDKWIFGSFDPRRLEFDDHTIIHEMPRSDRKIAMMEERIPWFWSTI